MLHSHLTYLRLQAERLHGMEAPRKCSLSTPHAQVQPS